MTEAAPNIWKSPAIVPQVGGFYQLRAGLVGFVSGPHEIGFTTAQGAQHVAKFWRGILLDAGGTPMLWYATGTYSPAAGVKHELDIMAELP